MNEDQNKDKSGEREALPLLIGDIIGESEVVSRQKRRKGRALIAVGGVLCILVTAIGLTFAFLTATPKALQNVETMPPADTESEEWRGAFSARNIYEECYQSAVTLKIIFVLFGWNNSVEYSVDKSRY